MADTVPLVTIDNLIKILCNESYRERGVSVKGILMDKNTGKLNITLKEPGIKDVVILGEKAGLLTRKTGIYLFTNDGINLCNIYQGKGKSKELWSFLHQCLQRIDVYKKFVDHLREPQKKKAAQEFLGKKPSAKYMLRWLKTMNMLSDYEVDKSVQYIPREPREEITEEEFLNALKDTYEEEAMATGPMWRGTFVAIRQLREVACQRLKIELNRFDELLRQLLSSNKLDSIKVRLAKGPAVAYERAGESVFVFEGEKFLYIALNEVQNGQI